MCRGLTCPNSISFNIPAACATSTKRESLVLKWLDLDFSCPGSNAISHLVNCVSLFFNCQCSLAMSGMQANKCKLRIWYVQQRFWPRECATLRTGSFRNHGFSYQLSIAFLLCVVGNVQERCWQQECATLRPGSFRNNGPLISYRLDICCVLLGFFHFRV